MKAFSSLLNFPLYMLYSVYFISFFLLLIYKGYMLYFQNLLFYVGIHIIFFTPDDFFELSLLYSFVFLTLNISNSLKDGINTFLYMYINCSLL